MKKRVDQKNLYFETVEQDVYYYSYKTLVAIVKPGLLIITNRKYSPATTRHCNQIRKQYDFLKIEEMDLEPKS